MATEIRLPDFGPLVDEATIVRWIKHEGDAVEKGDTLLEVDIDKSNIEIDAPDGGVILQILAKEGDVVAVGGVLAMIGTPENLKES